MFMSMLGVVVERNIFPLLLKLELSGRCETLEEGGLAVKLMREAPRLKHGLGMNAGSLRKSSIDRQGRRSRLLARLVGERQQLLFNLKVIVQWSARICGDGFQRGLLGRFVVAGSVRPRRHQASRGLHSREAHTEH